MCVFYCCVVCAPTAFIHRGKLQYKYLQQFCFLCSADVLLALHAPPLAIFDWVRFFTDNTHTHSENKNNIYFIDIVAMNVPFYMRPVECVYFDYVAKLNVDSAGLLHCETYFIRVFSLSKRPIPVHLQTRKNRSAWAHWRRQKNAIIQL